VNSVVLSFCFLCPKYPVYFVSFFKSLYSLWFFILVFHFLKVLLSFFSVSSVFSVVNYF